jgi:hypothetical protein
MYSHVFRNSCGTYDLYRFVGNIYLHIYLETLMANVIYSSNVIGLFVLQRRALLIYYNLKCINQEEEKH